VIIFQFPESFVCDDKNKALILKWRKWLSAGFKMGLELRSDSWFFDSADFARMKQSGQHPPNDTSSPSVRFQETLNWAATAAPNMTLIPIDEYLKVCINYLLYYLFMYLFISATPDRQKRFRIRAVSRQSPRNASAMSCKNNLLLFFSAKLCILVMSAFTAELAKIVF
jgi:hypothetical protein